jgi:threonylcarbamoyladenosine tRNA methylthiotransferase MtaB
MRTFSVQTLGCKVNQYESEQMASLLRSQGWVESEPESADLRIVNTCSVTMEAAGKSRQAVRRAVRLPSVGERSQVVVAGCWATSDTEEARKIAGVDLVVTHKDDVAARLGELTGASISATPGKRSLPLLNHRQPQQRAFLKIQDGCDAHCTYCIIPKLRPLLWSKPIEDLVTEARQLVEAGHVELVLTGIFLGAYGHETALRRRQDESTRAPLAEAIEALCEQVPGLRRVRLSSLEPGDLDDHLLEVLKSHEHLVPHFHLPLQSGSDELLRRMNRQYTRDDFLHLIDRLCAAFDRPALTTDIIVGFPGESEAAFAQTLDLVERSRFIHIHAFPYSPRPGTAAARWKDRFVSPAIANKRIDLLRQKAAQFSFDFRSTFVDQTVQLLVERNPEKDGSPFRHGRCERYFDVYFETQEAVTGDLVEVRIDRVTPTRTFGTLLNVLCKAPELSRQ